MSSKPALALTILILAAPTIAAAQNRPKLELRGKETTAIPRAAGAIHVDGVLDELAWQRAAKIERFYEWFPGDNIEPVVHTECFVTYDTSKIYVAFRAYDPEPRKIRANLTDRDAAFQDDTVGFILDPFSDGRRGFQFRINPLGVQMDGVNSDVDESEDWSWDTIWATAGRILPDGYVVEIAIPFNSLRFPNREGIQTWGFIAMRDYPRNDRHRMRSAPTDRNRSCLVCQFDQIAGFEGVSPGRNIELDPTLTGTRHDERDDFPDGSMENADSDVEAGLTARWGITPNVTLNGAVNPDFSQVEADAAQLDVNTRFALFYPEKRPFFLEGADFFSTPITTVFTRTVADPRFGLKLSGKAGRSAFGVFVADDEINNLIFPANQGSASASLDESVTTGVFRYRHDLGETSNIGVLYTDRAGDDYSNRVGGVDGSWRLGPSDTIRFQAIRSRTEYPDDLAEANGQPLGSFEGTGLLALYQHETRTWSWAVELTSLDPEFRADAGFVPRVDVRSAQAAVERTFWGDEDDWYRQIEIELNADRTEDHDGLVTDNGQDLQASILLGRQTFVELTLSPNEEYYDGTTYDNLRKTFYAESRPTRDSFVYLYYNWGETIDFANSRGADFQTLEPSFELLLARRFAIGATWTHQKLDVEGGELYNVELLQTKLVWNFSVRAFARVILQYSDLTRNPDLYTFPVDRKSEDLFTQALFSYKINPQTVFLVGYSDNYFGDQSIDLTQADRTLFVKLGYAWVF